MRFLTKETWKQPPNEEIKALMPAEVEQAKKLSDQGVIEATYMASDLTSGWLVWDVDSQVALEKAHNTLPLHPYMNSEVLAVLTDGD